MDRPLTKRLAPSRLRRVRNRRRGARVPLLRFSLQMRPSRSWLLAFAVSALVPIACRTVEGAPDNSFECDQPVADYCAAQSGGCPASDAPADLCAWLARRGGNPSTVWGEPPGYALTCEEMPERKDFSVVEGDSPHTYVFARGSLSYVFESRPAARCVAGPQHGVLGSCTFVDWGHSLRCAADGGTE